MHINKCKERLYCTRPGACIVADKHQILSLGAGLYGQGLAYGAPVVLIWGWVCAGTLHIFVGVAMSELCSAFPVSGGLYYWAFMLADKHGPFASWVVGWINLLGQVICCPGLTHCISLAARQHRRYQHSEHAVSLHL